ncbi:proline oxidase [Seiridium cupressi]
MANSNSALLNPDRNHVLHFITRRLWFDHFVAGENAIEVRQTVNDVKKMGYKGVILGYAREVNVTGGDTNFESPNPVGNNPDAAYVEEWKNGTLKTLSLIGKGDFLAVKFSGAGDATLDAMACGDDPPQHMWEAMEEICDAAARQGSRLWVDAEQQDLQPTIDEWTIRLMRKCNKGGTALVYTTMQAYLKRTTDNIGRHLRLAQDEGWILAVKLVRGAYIATEQRCLIHDTIQDTHSAYDTIAKNMLRQEYPGVPSSKPYPRSELFLATHNEDSIKLAWSIQTSLVQAGRPTVELGFGQLQGMADEVGCSLVQLCQDDKSDNTVARQAIEEARRPGTPNAFKCLSWGSTRECLQFLLRRVHENADAFGRTKFWAMSLRSEILRRFKNLTRFGTTR